MLKFYKITRFKSKPKVKKFKQSSQNHAACLFGYLDYGVGFQRWCPQFQVLQSHSQHHSYLFWHGSLAQIFGRHCVLKPSKCLQIFYPQPEKTLSCRFLYEDSNLERVIIIYLKVFLDGGFLFNASTNQLNFDTILF